MKKILVALSGGVDSAVSALLLKQQGFDVSGAYIKTWMNEEGSDIFADCPWDEDIKDAEAVAKTLDIDFEVVNMIKDYRERIVHYMVEGYKSGITPNPDIMCNREMKFGVFLDYAKDNGFDAVATGHYCQKSDPDSNGRYNLLQGADPNKDQSYFLALINQEQLSRALFPIGHLQKPAVREIAQKHALPNFKKKDSQGICFLGKVSINDFLKQYIPDNPGPIINTQGKLLGEHKGLHRFTLGQRKGIGIPSNSDFNNYVVIKKDFETNTLTVAFESESSDEIWQKEVNVCNLSYINEKIVGENLPLLGKVRYRDPSVELKFTSTQKDCAHIQFADPQRALAKGQILALYQGNILLGGGTYY